MKSRRNGWILLLFLIIGAFLGGLLGNVLGDYAPFLNWTSHTYGINPPLSVNLDMLSLTFGLTLRLTVAGVIGLVLGYFAYRAL